MSGTKRLVCHLSVAVSAIVGAAAAAPQTPDATGAATFSVFFRGSQVGTERVVVSRDGSGWHISASASLGQPFDLVTDKFELDYDADWQPQRLLIDGRLRGQTIGLKTTFGPTSAANEATQGNDRASNTQQVSTRTVVLPNSFFGAYEALAARLATATVGTEIPVYVPAEAEVTAKVNSIAPRRIVTPEGTVELRDFSITLNGLTGPVPLEIWTDSRQRLARVFLPAASVVVMRGDFTSVLVREEIIRNPGDSEAFIPANGFNLGSTVTKPPVTKPPPTPARVPAVIFVSSPGPQGREYLAYGIPLFGQLAGKVAGAGYFVVRYDGRGVGQSGGRLETAGVSEYADDVLSVVQWLRRRPEIDADRIAVVGYDEGGPIAMLAASREKRIKGVALLAAPGRSGRELTLEQQERLLTGLAIPDAEKAARRALQSRINDAAVTGRGWDGIPANLRREAESAWFRSWLQFDPAQTMKRLNQPILIVHGTLDRELPPEHADRLEELARTARERPPAFTKKVVVTGVNHLLVPAASGNVEEYTTLEARAASPAVTDALVTWLSTVWSLK